MTPQEKEVREALARGYCTERNKHKVLDPDLIEDMAREIADSALKEIGDKDNIIKNLSRLLEICRGAIDDAIYCEDGLDGAAGEDILKLIKEIDLEKMSKCQECDHLTKENLKLGAQLSAQKERRVTDEEIDSEVFKIILSQPEYINLPGQGRPNDQSRIE